MSRYEILETMTEDETHDAKLFASWTAGNGIRIDIQNQFDEYERDGKMLDEQGWDIYLRCFQLTHEQAKILGEALLRWAADTH